MKTTPDAIFSRNWTYTEETFDECQNRYTGFGLDLYRLLREQLPETFSCLKFYQSDLYQREDSYAVCEIDPPFGIQLDPDCEAIVLANGITHIEIGRWSAAPCQEALDFIRQQFKTKAEPVLPANPL